MTSLVLAFLAGALSTLSPCVLPLLPIVLGAAVSQHRLGPAALAAGLAVSFVAVGLFVATIGYAIGLDGSVFRVVAAVLMAGFGVVLMLPSLQARVATAGGPISNWAQERFGRVSGTGLSGQFAVGLLLGAVWSPCVGPTLGAATLLASQGRDFGQVSLIMAGFGVGAALPLLILGALSRRVLMGVRDRLLKTVEWGKIVLGSVLILLALFIATGTDRVLETFLVGLSPAWLTTITTRF